MNAEPATIVERIDLPDEAFRREVRAELKHLREMVTHINSTLDVMLKMLLADEKRDEAENA